MRTKHVVAITIFCVAIAADAFAQSVPPPPPPPVSQTNPNAPPLKVTSRVVQVNVIVQNKNGQPVTGLTKNDFTVLDQGQPQTLASFSEQSNKVTATLASVAASPNSFSNRYQERFGSAPSASVILIDSLNMLGNNSQPSRNNMTAVRAQVAKFLKQMQPRDRVALYFVSDRIYIVHDFTDDAAELLQAMDIIPHLQQDQLNATPPMDFAPGAVNTGSMMAGDSGAAAAIQISAQFNAMNRIEQTLAMLEAIGNHLAGFPGRKNLIWLTAGFPFKIGGGLLGGTPGPEKKSYDVEVEKAARTLSNANVAIYAIDARGLTVGQPDPQTVNSMTVLADRTGGRLFRNTNDFGGAIRTAIDDSRVSYVLSYYPNHNKWNGDFREIKVRVNRPGVEIRARRGYLATPDVAVSPKSKEEIMVDAAKNPIESATLGMDVQVDSVANPDARRIKAQIRLDPAQLQLTKMDDHWTDSVDVKWVQVDSFGRVLSSTSQSLNLNIPHADYENVLSKGLTFSGDVNLVKDAADIRIVVRDSGNGSVGTVNISIDRLFPPTPVQPQAKK